MLTDENPQVLADIRKQIFGLQEDILLQARRIFEQLTQYVTVPQVFKPKKIRLRTHMHCFIAKEFLDWLVASRECVSRKEGVELCQKMQEKEIIHPLLKDNLFSDDDSIFKFGDKGSQSSSRRGSEQVESIQGGMTSKQQTDLLHRLRLLHEESIDGADDDHIEEVDGEDVDVLVQLYTIAQVRCDQSDSSQHLRSIFMTNSHIILADENHQYPLPRLHPPPNLTKDHFTRKEMHRITNITQMDFYSDSSCHMTIHFFDEETSTENSWFILTASSMELKRISVHLRSVWQQEFHLELTSNTLPSVQNFLL